jgi:hypothetical protein
MRTILTPLACLALAPIATGCAGRAAEYCDLACDCSECSEREYDECLAVYDGSEEQASIYDCDFEFDDAHVCVVENNSCTLDVFLPEVECADEFQDLDQCIDSGSALR